MPLEIRSIEPDELDQMLLVDAWSFGNPPYRPDAPNTWSAGDLDRTRVAFDGDQIVGVSRNYTFECTMPGGSSLPIAAVSWVSVLPTHRRRGVLTAMIGALHQDARDHNEPAAALTASEGDIYGRFGYGIAAWRLGLTAERARIRFINEENAGSVRLLTRDEGEKVLPALYERTRPTRAGMVSRPDFWWPQAFWHHIAGNDKAFYIAVHSDDAGIDDGYVTYEITGDWNGGLPDRHLLIWDFQTANADAYADLWRYIFGIDLVGTVAATNLPVDDPLKHLVRDSRRVRVDFLNDGLWLAPLDAARVLASRRYAIDDRLVIEVHTPDGTTTRLALDGGPDGAECSATSARPDLTCSSATLGACVLGGNRWSELATAGRVEAADPSRLLRADAMFLTTPAPALLSFF